MLFLFVLWYFALGFSGFVIVICSFWDSLPYFALSFVVFAELLLAAYLFLRGVHKWDCYVGSF